MAINSAHVKTLTTIDDGLYRAIVSFADRTGWLQRPMELYTTASLGVIALLGVVAWWLARSRSDRRGVAATLWLGLGTLMSIGAGLALKQVFQESRPCLAIHVATVQTCPGATDYSFPSDHTVVAAALAIGVLLINRRLGMVGLVLALVEGFSRVYLGQHYPHDVAAGLALAAVVILLGWAVLRRPLTRLIELLERTPLRPLLTAT